MRQWVKDAHRTLREAKAHASRTSDACLHMACVRAIEAMLADGLLMPSNLRTYARETRELYGDQFPSQTTVAATGSVAQILLEIMS
jgi:hypothetical protein